MPSPDCWKVPAATLDVRVVLPTGFSPISVAVYGTDRMKKSIRDLAWFLRYVGLRRGLG